MSDTTELTVIPEKNQIPALFSTEDGIENLIALIEKEALAVAQDYSTDKGRKAARSLAAKVSRSKTLIDEVGKDLNEERNRLNKEVNAKRNIAKDRLDALRDKIKGPADEFEQKEAERVQAHMIALGKFKTDTLDAHASTAELKAVLEQIDRIEVGPAWEEFEADARAAKAAAIEKYTADLEIAEAREAQEQELAQLRAEKEERERRDREEKEAREKEKHYREEAERLKKERLEAEQRAAEEAKAEAERKAKETEERHQRELAEAEEKAARAAEEERQRMEEEKAAELEASRQRAADENHRYNVRAEIIQAITALNPSNYEQIIDAMIDGKIPHVEVKL